MFKNTLINGCGLIGSSILRAIHNKKLFRFHRFVLARCLGLIFLLFSTMIAKTYSNIIRLSSKGTINNTSPILLYTWFPRVWTNKYGTLQDMYLADLPNQIKTKYKPCKCLYFLNGFLRKKMK